MILKYLILFIFITLYLNLTSSSLIVQSSISSTETTCQNSCYINHTRLANNIKRNERLSYQSTNNGISTHNSICQTYYHTPKQDVLIGTHRKEYPTHWTVTFTIYDQNDRGEIYLTLPYDSNSTHYYSIECCTSCPFDQDVLNVNIDGHRTQEVYMKCPILSTNVTSVVDETNFLNCFEFCNFLLNFIYSFSSSLSCMNCESTLTNLCKDSMNIIDSNNCLICDSIPLVCDISINCSIFTSCNLDNERNYLINKKILKNNALSQHKRITVESFSSNPIQTDNNVVQYHPIASFGSTWFKTDHCNCINDNNCCCISDHCNLNMKQIIDVNKDGDNNELLINKTCNNELNENGQQIISITFFAKLINNKTIIGLSNINDQFLLNSNVPPTVSCQIISICTNDFPLVYQCLATNILYLEIKVTRLLNLFNMAPLTIFYINDTNVCQKNINLSCSSSNNNIQLSTTKIINVESNSNHSNLFTIYKKKSIQNTFQEINVDSVRSGFNQFNNTQKLTFLKCFNSTNNIINLEKFDRDVIGEFLLIYSINLGYNFIPSIISSSSYQCRLNRLSCNPSAFSSFLCSLIVGMTPSNSLNISISNPTSQNFILYSGDKNCNPLSNNLIISNCLPTYTLNSYCYGNQNKLIQLAIQSVNDQQPIYSFNIQFGFPPNTLISNNPFYRCIKKNNNCFNFFCSLINGAIPVSYITMNATSNFSTPGIITIVDDYCVPLSNNRSSCEKYDFSLVPTLPTPSQCYSNQYQQIEFSATKFDNTIISSIIISCTNIGNNNPCSSVDIYLRNKNYSCTYSVNSNYGLFNCTLNSIGSNVLQFISSNSFQINAVDDDYFPNSNTIDCNVYHDKFIFTLPTRVNIQSSTNVKSFQLNSSVECSVPTCCPSNIQCPNGTSCCCTYSQEIVFCGCLTPEECKD